MATPNYDNSLTVEQNIATLVASQIAGGATVAPAVQYPHPDTFPILQAKAIFNSDAHTGGAAGAASSIPAGLVANVAIKTTTYTTSSDDFVLEGNSASPFTVTAVAASSNAGKMVYYTNKGTGIMTVDFTGLGTVDGVNTVALNQWDSIGVYSDGTIYKIFSGYLPPKASLAVTGTVVDWSKASIFTKSLTANWAPTFSNTSDGQTIILEVVNTGAFTIDWSGISKKWAPNGTVPVMSSGAGKLDTYTFYKSSNGIVGAFTQNAS